MRIQVHAIAGVLAMLLTSAAGDGGGIDGRDELQLALRLRAFRRLRPSVDGDRLS